LLRFEAETNDDDTDEDDVFISRGGLNDDQEGSSSHRNALRTELPKRKVTTGKISGDAWKTVKATEEKDWNMKAKQLKYDYIKSDEGREYFRQTCVDDLRKISDVRCVHSQSLGSKRTWPHFCLLYEATGSKCNAQCILQPNRNELLY
jgi:hypothetical protein